MKKSSAPMLLIFSLVCSFLAAYSITLWNQARDYTITSHSLRFEPVFMIGITALIFLILWGLRRMAWQVSIRPAGIGLSSRILKWDAASQIPFLMLLLLPLAASHYIDSNDFRVRVGAFIVSVFISIAYLKGKIFWKSKSLEESLLQKMWTKIEAIPLKKKITILFVLALFLFNIGSVMMISGGITFSGDEPHYLLICHSLLKDGDFQLSNNYAQKDYATYMPDGVELDVHLAPGTEGYSFHSPGVALFLLPFYALGSLFSEGVLLFFIRFGMSVFGALLGVQLYLYSLQEWKKEKLAVYLWLIFSLTTPIFFHSIHVYPEIFLAFFSLTVFRLLRFSVPFPRSKLLVIGFLLGLFLWLHAVKYIFISIPLILYSIWVLIRQKRVGWNFVYFMSPLLLLTLLHMVFSSTLYGSLSPFSVSLKGTTTSAESVSMIKEFLSAVPFKFRLETLIGYFFDQRDGLLFYAPVYAFSFLGMIEMGKRNWRKLLTLCFLTAPYVLVQAFLTQRGAYAPQARIQVAVFWVMALFLGYFLAYNQKKVFTLLFDAALVFSFLTVAVLLKNPWALYQPTTSGTVLRSGDLFVHLSNLHFYLPQYLPSFLKMDNRGWIPNYVWIGIFFLFCVTYLLVKKHSFTFGLSRQVVMVCLILLVVFVWGALYPRFVLQSPTNVIYPTGEKVTFYGLGRVLRMTSPGQFQLPRDQRSYVFYFTSWQPLDQLKVEFGSPEGTFETQIRYFDKSLFKGKTQREMSSLHFPAEAPYRFKGRFLYSLSIDLKKEEGLIAYTHPFFFSLHPTWGSDF
jgi:hypothetical protein